MKSDDTKINIEKFAEDFDTKFFEIKRFVTFLNVSGKYEESLYRGMDIIESKFKKLKKSKSIDDASKYVKVKKINKAYGDCYEDE